MLKRIKLTLINKTNIVKPESGNWRIAKSIDDLIDIENENTIEERLVLQNLLNSEKVSKLAELGQESVVSLIANISDQSRKSQIEMLYKGHYVLLNNMGGWCYMTKEMFDNDYEVEYLD